MSLFRFYYNSFLLFRIIFYFVCRTKDGLSKWLQSSLEFILGKNESENAEEELESQKESRIQQIDKFFQKQIFT